MKPFVGASVVAFGCLLGCSAPAACTEGSFGEEPNLHSKPLTGTMNLDATNASAARAAVLRLRDLPRLWQGSGNIFGGYVTLGINTEYTGEPVGYDGKTKMPRVAATLTLDGALDHVTTSTLAFASGSSLSPRLKLFESCDDEAHTPGCCVYGSQECSVPLSLSVKRLDGAPFPKVRVSWTLEAAASATSCPLNDDVQVRVALEESAR